MFSTCCVAAVLACVLQLLLLCVCRPRLSVFFFFLMIRRPPRSTLDRSSAASDVYKRQVYVDNGAAYVASPLLRTCAVLGVRLVHSKPRRPEGRGKIERFFRTVRDQFLVEIDLHPVSYTHLRAHETVLDLVCRLLLEKKINTSP